MGNFLKIVHKKQMKHLNIKFKTYEKIRKHNKPPVNVNVDKDGIWYSFGDENDNHFDILQEFINKSALKKMPINITRKLNRIKIKGDFLNEK